ncbi:MAG TPA: hypothetical protein VEA40_09295, partial [Ramlibacter sp.]|nr:hypothetical protein [Ramlibacter sp.]
GISMIWVYGVGYVVAVVMALFNLHVLWRLVTGRISDDELVQVHAEDEEAAPQLAAVSPAEPERVRA